MIDLFLSISNAYISLKKSDVIACCGPERNIKTVKKKKAMRRVRKKLTRKGKE